MSVIAMSAGAPRAAAMQVSFREDVPVRRSHGGEARRRIVADAMAQERSLRLAEWIREYASESRANGDSIHEVLEVLMTLARDTTPTNTSSAKRSSEIAEWAIAGYFEDSQSIRVAMWCARGARAGRGVRGR